VTDTDPAKTGTEIGVKTGTETETETAVVVEINPVTEKGKGLGMTRSVTAGTRKTRAMNGQPINRSLLLCRIH
jgi:hypothetical protein